jgi:CDP-diacylglycerol--glycerol-3-phosphate 3-phosphatidyltransferase
VGLYSIKPWFVRRLGRVEDALVAYRVSPDTLTGVAVLVSVAAGVAIAAGGLLGEPLIWLAVPPLVLARLALNALDGSVARRTRRSTPFGSALNEIGDRMSDAATVGATAFVVRPSLALGAVASCFLASHTGVIAQAVGGRREYAGPMGKADRAGLLALGASAGALAGSALPFTVVLYVIAAGSLATAGVRVARLRAALRARRPRAELLEPTYVDVPTEIHVEEEMLHALVR